MEWIQYFAYGVLLWFLVRRLMPMKGLTNLSGAGAAELLKNQKEHVFIDVREVHEYKSGHIKGFKNIPLSQLANRLAEIDRKKAVVLTCRSGMRSRQAAKILQKNGFTRISHLKNGISSWDEGLVK